MLYFFYYIPVGLNVRLRRSSVVTWAFTFTCVLVFLLNRYMEWLLPRPLWDLFDFNKMIYLPGDSPVIAVAAAFLHFGWLHLLGNMLYLVFFGRYVEDRIGRGLYAFLYLSSAGIGNFLQSVFNVGVLDDPGLGIIGASGAVSGLLGAFSVRFIRSKMKIAYWAFMPLQAYTRGGRVEMPALFAIVLWFGLQAARGLVQLEGASPNVAYVTHIGGFIWGLAVAVAAGQFGQGAYEAQIARAERYMKKGEGYAAQGSYLRYLTYCPEDPDAHIGLARALLMTNDQSAARKTYVRALEFLLACQRRGDAEELFREALRSGKSFALAADRHLNLAFGLERNLKQDLAIIAYLNFANRYPHNAEASFALLRAAGLYRNAEPDVARDLYKRILDEYPDNEWIEFVREEHRGLVAMTA